MQNLATHTRERIVSYAQQAHAERMQVRALRGAWLNRDKVLQGKARAIFVRWPYVRVLSSCWEPVVPETEGAGRAQVDRMQAQAH